MVGLLTIDPNPRRQRRPELGVPEHRPRVLLAEDDPEMRCLLASALRRRGCCVLEARDGNDLVDQLGALCEGAPDARPDLLVTDVRMPLFSGLDVLTAVSLMTWDLPIILITAFSSPELRDAAARLGAVAVLDKPFDIADLVGAVERTLFGKGWGANTSPSIKA